MIMATSPVMLTRAFPLTERGRALGIMGLVVAAGTSAGPTLGGVITHLFSWRWIFYVNVPIGLIGIGVSLRLLKQPLRPSWGRQQFDPLGALLLWVSISCLMLALTFGEEVGWGSWDIFRSPGGISGGAGRIHFSGKTGSSARGGFLHFSQPPVHGFDYQQFFMFSGALCRDVPDALLPGRAAGRCRSNSREC